MTFGELLLRLGQRIDAKDDAAAMHESVMSDLQSLRQFSRPLVPGRHTTEENIRISLIEFTAGRLHLRRWRHLLQNDSHPAAATELYQAFLAFRQLVDGPSGLPPWLPVEALPRIVKQLFGTDSDAEIQGEVAYFLLANAPPEAERDYHAVAVDLLRTAADRIPHDYPARSEWLRVLGMADRQRRLSKPDWDRIRIDEWQRWLHTTDGPPPSMSPEDTLLHWEEVADRLRERLRTSLTESRPELLNESGMIDAITLVRASLSNSSGIGSPESLRRVAEACRLAGTLYMVRATAKHSEEGFADLSRAILFLDTLELGGNRLPEPANSLIGRDADAETQAHFATLFLYQSQSTHDSALIAAAIVLLARGIASLPSGAPEQAGYMANVAVAYGLRYDLTGIRADLDQAIACAERSLTLTPPTDHNLAQRLHRIGSLYLHQARRTRVTADYERAVQANEDALEAASDGDQNLGLYLLNLGVSYRERAQRPERQQPLVRDAADRADLDKAISITERAVAASRDRVISDVDRHHLGPLADDASRAWVREALYSLGQDYLDRYRDTGDPDDVTRAVASLEQGMGALQITDPARVKFLSYLAIAYTERSNFDKMPIPSEVLHRLAGEIDSLGHALVSHRIWAYRNVGLLAAKVGDQMMAAELLAKAIRLLPLVISEGNEWEDRERLVGEHLGLVEEAIGIHCRAGDPEGAVEISELGRGIVMPSVAGSRSLFAALEDQYPELATTYHRLREILNRPHRVLLGRTIQEVMGHRTYEVGDRLQWQSDYDQLVEQIRRLPGFSRFQPPVDLNELRSAVVGGVVVLVNVDREGGDAIIIAADADPKHISLPCLEFADAQKHGSALLHAAHFGVGLAGALERRQVLPRILQWLWTAIVEPVLAALPSYPRIWWMPSGLLNLFPLHAAGLPGQPGALELALSSYTTTLRALALARSEKPASARRQLTVALEQTPGLPHLPAVVREAEVLQAKYPDALRLHGRNATVGRVLSALPEATWAHFACHCTTDYTAPSRGGIRLYDGVLSAPDVSALHLRHAELAYLSACSTADRGVRFANESITMASVFQLAGFRHVVGSLWPLEDEMAAMIAAAFYDRMQDDSGADRAPEALRQISIELRSAQPDRPDLWAPMIHIGP